MSSGLSVQQVADAVAVDPKTVERWITTGRTPHRTHRWKVAGELGADEAYLWPDTLDQPAMRAASVDELVAVYPNRGDVPAELWCGLAECATEHFDLLVYAGLFLFDAHPKLLPLLRDRAERGVRIRLAFGDPDSEAVVARGQEEGTDVPSRVRMTLGLIAPLIGVPGVEVRLHRTTLYTSIYAGDSVLLVNTHAYGAPAARSPVLHLQRTPGGRLVDHYRDSYERVWGQAQPYG